MRVYLPQIDKDKMLFTTVFTTLIQENTQNRGDLGFLKGITGGFNGTI
jgi:hypothetical protein